MKKIVNKNQDKITNAFNNKKWISIWLLYTVNPTGYLNKQNCNFDFDFSSFN